MSSSDTEPPLRLVRPAETPPAGERGGDDLDAPDDELLARARGGDRATFEKIVRRHQPKVIAFATRFFGQRAVATDVAQEVFLDLMVALPRYRPEGRFTIYLYRIMLNRCRMTARTVRYEDRARERLWVEAAARADLISPDESAARERQRRLGRALLEIPEKHRAVLQLRFWGGLSHEEIAEVLATREGTVKSRLFNALAMLREKLGEQP
jgi:RNA polymerase sigma-70 factor (ECF subfamily)